MSWTPCTRSELDALVERELSECSDLQRRLFEHTRIPLEKWSQSPWGDQGGGFWAVAVIGESVLWYNDIEEVFNVSRFSTRGVIPASEYWCNQDSLNSVLSNDPEYVRRVTSDRS